jgi:DNA-binding SARP family transcriptional activator
MTPLAPLGRVALGHAEAMYRMLVNDRDGALEAVEQALAVARGKGVKQHVGELRAIAAAACLGVGDTRAAGKWLDAALSEELPRLRRFDLCLYHYVAGWHAQLVGDPVAAYQQQKQAFRLSTEVGIPFYEVICRLAMVPIVADHDEQKCGVHLRKVHALTRNINSHLLAFMALLPWADIALTHGRRQSGLNSLAYAFGLGREHGYYHVIGWLPEMMARLCVTALEEGIEVEYARALIRRRGLQPEVPPYHLEEWPWPLRIRTLGTFVIETEPRGQGGGSRKQGKPIELLKVLIALGGKNVRAEHLASALWPHVDGDYAYRSLNTTLHRLRKLLGGDDMLTLVDGRLGLDPRRCLLDTWALERIVEELAVTLQQPVSSDTGELLERLERALFVTYGGEFLAGEEGSPHFLASQERLRARFVQGVSGIARHHAKAGHFDDAVGCLEKGLQAAPASEPLYRELRSSNAARRRCIPRASRGLRKRPRSCSMTGRSRVDQTPEAIEDDPPLERERGRASGRHADRRRRRGVCPRRRRVQLPQLRGGRARRRGARRAAHLSDAAPRDPGGATALRRQRPVRALQVPRGPRHLVRVRCGALPGAPRAGHRWAIHGTGRVPGARAGLRPRQPGRLRRLGYAEVARAPVVPHPLIHVAGDALLMVKALQV